MARRLDYTVAFFNLTLALAMAAWCSFITGQEHKHRQFLDESVGALWERGATLQSQNDIRIRQLQTAVGDLQQRIAEIKTDGGFVSFGRFVSKRRRSCPLL